MSRVIFDPKLVGETKNYDFVFPVAAGGSISSATVTATVYSGVDSNPSSILTGDPAVSGATVTQSLMAGTAGVLYDLLCSATLADGQVLQMSAYLAVVPVI